MHILKQMVVASATNHPTTVMNTESSPHKILPTKTPEGVAESAYSKDRPAKSKIDTANVEKKGVVNGVVEVVHY